LNFYEGLLIERWFVHFLHPWFIRDHEFHFGLGTSMFAFGSDYGLVRSWVVFCATHYEKYNLE